RPTCSQGRWVRFSRRVARRPTREDTRPAFLDPPVSPGFVFPTRRSRTMSYISERWVRFSRRARAGRAVVVGFVFSGRAAAVSSHCPPTTLLPFTEHRPPNTGHQPPPRLGPIYTLRRRVAAAGGAG